MSGILLKLMAASSFTAAATVDSTPNSFSFTDVSDVALSSTRTSNTITVAGMDSGASATVTVTGGTYSKNFSNYISDAGIAAVNDTFSVRHTSSSSSSTSVNTTLTIGGVSDTFTSTTEASSTDVTPNAVNWNDLNTSASSATTNSQTISGINTTITLNVSFTEDRDNYTLRATYGGSQTFSYSSPGSFNINVSNGDVVYFYASGGRTDDSEVTISNTSDGGAVLDTFIVNLED